MITVKYIRRTLTILLISIFILLLLPILSVTVLADGLASDTLTIRVGYFGGPYYVKRVFTADELWGMNVQYVDYTFIDNMPAVVIDHVAGVAISDIMYAAGIDMGSVQSFNFWTNDKAGGYYNSMTKSSLIDTMRYCWYSLPDNFDYDTGTGNELAATDGVPVPAMIALADDWRRVIAGASFGSDYGNLDSSIRFRLVYGQTDANTHTASESAKWIHSIEVTLGGAPTLTMDESVLDLEVGSSRRVEARILAADSVIAANAQIIWSSSDESIATVDENGNITVHAEGSAVVTASFGGQSVSVVVNGTLGTGGGNNNGGGSENSAAASHPPPTQPDTAMPDEPTSNTPPETVTVPKGVIGYEITLLGGAEDYGDSGGEQNWREDDMSDTSIEMPIIKKDIDLWFLLVIAIIFIFGGTFQYAWFRFDSNHAHNRVKP